MAVAAVVMVAADATVTEPFPRPRSLVVRPVHAASQSKYRPVRAARDRLPNGLSVLTGRRRGTCACWPTLPRKNTMRQEGRKFGGRSSLLSSGRGLCPLIRWLWCFRLPKKSRRTSVRRHDQEFG